ncbi:MAG: NTP transferase domain-containing protein [Anditalea sp.]
MTSKDKHQKHASLNKPAYGEFGRNELAFLGAPCGVIQSLTKDLIHQLAAFYSAAYVDADHKEPEGSKEKGDQGENPPGMMLMTDKILFTRIDTHHSLSAFDKRALFNKKDLVLINGNHFKGKSQVLLIDPRKSLENKLDKLTDVKLIVLRNQGTHIPDFIKEAVPDWHQKPVLYLEETDKLSDWIKGWMDQNKPAIKGLVLAGGESKRMQKDKGELAYHGKSQREHLLSLIQPFCSQAFLSCNAKQAIVLKDKFPLIEDAFFGLGPMGGILSAFRTDPNAAWLTVACDLPYLSNKTLEHLLMHRNPSKVATAFLDPKGKFPEPLVTLWEPRSYPVLLEYLSQGYSCPRKVLINSEVEILNAPDKREFYNVNHPEEYEEVVRELNLNTER